MVSALKYCAGAALALLASCTNIPYRPGPPLTHSTQQGWSADQQIAWYRGSQGSRLIPEAWLRQIEAPNSETLFLDPAHFDKYNYLPRAEGETDDLPIGFARTRLPDTKLALTKLRWYKGQGAKTPWIGLNCAACHTAEVRVGNTPYRIDGAPTLADFQGFTKDLRAAMQSTYDDPAKWSRFAARVDAARAGRRSATRMAADAQLLRNTFGSLLAHQNDLARFDDTRTEYGHGRLDAVGHILNKVAWLNSDATFLRGEPDAPVSYPFIWNAGQHDFVQWNGLVPNVPQKIGRGNIDFGALGRNTSEVIGVFAEVRIRRLDGASAWERSKGYPSSIDVKNLHAMERILHGDDRVPGLQSPAWPAAFGVPDQKDVDAGRELFTKRRFDNRTTCADCHAHLDRADLTTKIIVDPKGPDADVKKWVRGVMSPVWGEDGVGTDPWMMCNAYTYQARGGLMTGTPYKLFNKDKDGNTELLPPLGPTSDYLATQAIGSLLGQKKDIVWLALNALVGKEPRIGVALLPPPPPPPPGMVELPPPFADQLSRDDRLAVCVKDTANPPVIRDDDGDKARRILAYKARPLNGIWATAPYLHNGSVKSLYELLLPPAQRATKFWVGNREFDTINVGFRDAESTYGSWFRVFENGVVIHGNSNAGHDYGNANMLPEERRLLVEYMKSL